MLVGANCSFVQMRNCSLRARFMARNCAFLCEHARLLSSHPGSDKGLVVMHQILERVKTSPTNPTETLTPPSNKSRGPKGLAPSFWQKGKNRNPSLFLRCRGRVWCLFATWAHDPSLTWWVRDLVNGTQAHGTRIRFGRLRCAVYRSTSTHNHIEPLSHQRTLVKSDGQPWEVSVQCVSVTTHVG